MKKIVGMIIATLILLVACPFLVVSLVLADAGMAVCFILFFAINPLFSVFIGIFSGQNIKKLWPLPIFNAGAFLAGTWLVFAMGEPAFLLYGGIYLVIGVCAMVITGALKKR